MAKPKSPSYCGFDDRVILGDPSTALLATVI
jgi:hypothetical protein